MKRKSSLITMVLVILIVSLLYPTFLTVEAEDLWFSAPHDLRSLEIEGISTVELEMKKTVKFRIDPSKCVCHEMPDGYVYLEVEDLKPSTAPGEPRLPMKTIVVDLPRDANIIKVVVVEGEYLSIEGGLKIVPMPEPRSWTSKEKKEVYDLNSYFPGEILSYDVGCDNERRYVFLRIYPVQYIPAREEAILIEDITIDIHYSIEDSSLASVESPLPKVSLPNCECVIITPSSLLAEANELAIFHNDLNTLVITTEEIWRDYEASGDPAYPGYGTDLNGKEKICNYNYTLARKITSFLNDPHPELSYVILFGDARLVPPSYYCSEKGGGYNDWIPTDHLYISPDDDLVPNYRVGRIPVSDSEEATHVVEKIKDWDTSDWSGVTVAGGRPYNTDHFNGELTTVDSINRGSFDGMKIEKCFRTEDAFDSEHLEDVLSGGRGIIYHIGHGSGDTWSLEGDPLSTNDLMKIKKSVNLPIVVSIACTTGAFDTNLMYGGFDTSFGEGILLSDAGGIAYVGSSRVSYGTPCTHLDDGYLIVDRECYMAGMLTYFLDAYDEEETLGGMQFNAINEFLKENYTPNRLNNLTLFEFVLLGDPALELPKTEKKAVYKQPFLSADHDGENITITLKTDSPEVKIKLSKADRVINITEETTERERAYYTFTPSSNGTYLVRGISSDGKEGWLYVSVG